jgi:hypothetical protein
MNLGGGFGDTEPSHPLQAVASLPGAEDFLDPAADAVNGPVEGGKPGEGTVTLMDWDGERRSGAAW